MRCLPPVMAGKQGLSTSRRCLRHAGGWARAVPLAALLASGTAWAQVLIAPVLVELGARQRVVAVTVSLSDKASAPLRLQAELLRWRQDLQGAAVTEPSDDLLVSPPIADVQPGGKQVFRVALRGARPRPEELAYRLIFEDLAVPSASGDDAPGLNIKFRLRYDLPVLLAPAGPVVNALHWKPCEPAKPTEATAAAAQVKPETPRMGEACVRLFNAGNRRVKVQTLTVLGGQWQKALGLKEGDNLLAGDTREWHVPLQAGQAGALQGVQVNTARGETLEAEASGF